MASSSHTGDRYAFDATLEKWAEGMDYCAVAVPPEITTALETKAAVLVMARVNGSAPFKVSLFPVGGGRHYIRIKAKVRKVAAVTTGDVVNVQFTVLDRAAITLPHDVRDALERAGAQDAFAALTPGRQNFMLRRIDEAAKAETRAKRIAAAVAQLARDSKRAEI